MPESLFSATSIELSGYCRNSQISSIISLAEIIELKELIADTKISEDKIHLFFNQFLKSTMPSSLELQSCLSFLGQKEHSPSDKAPLFEFLEYINGYIHPKLLAELTAWKKKVAERLKIDLKSICNRVAEFKKNNQVFNINPPLILLKIEPKNLVSKELFLLRVWLYQNNQYQPQDISEQDYTLQQLESSLEEIVGKAIRQFGATANKAIIEVILPFFLFHWDINHLKVKAGPIKQALGKLYAVNIRSWDRTYHSDYDIVRPKWSDKWKQSSCSHECIKMESINYLYDENTCCETLYEKLEQTALIFMPLCVLPWKTERINEIFGTALAAGLPFAFWSPQAIISQETKQAIEALLCSEKIDQWTIKIQEKKAQQFFLNDLMVLCDNPERLPPDVDYILTSSEL